MMCPLVCVTFTIMILPLSIVTSPNNVLLTAHHVAKISDLGVAKVIRADSRKTMTKAPGTVDFMPPESLEWPRPTKNVIFDPKTRKMMALSEVERRQQYLDKMTGEAEVLRPLVEECLDYDPALRPTIATVSERIQASKDIYMKECPQDVITILQKMEKQKVEIDKLQNENKQKDNEIQQLTKENVQKDATIKEMRAQIVTIK